MVSKLFPPGYEHWLSSRLTAERSESLATCDNCAMVQPSGLTRDKGPFLNHLKCCTYFPYVPNFSLGALSPADFAKVGVRGIFLPLGLYPTSTEQNKVHQFGSEGFGKKVELLCPFFDKVQNQCSIWENRPGVCTTYFCKSDQGQKGLDHWKDVERYLNHFEFKLACAVIEKMKLNENVLSFCQAAVNGAADDVEQDYFIAEAWGDWALEKAEFYNEARKIALSIASDELNNMIDPEFIALEKQFNLKV